MKKSFALLFLLLFLSCSNDGFESQIAASSQKGVWCYIKEGSCKKISENLCLDIGVVVDNGNYEGCNGSNIDVSSSSDENVSSSSDNNVGSSSSKASSSSRASSSSANAVSSSSSVGGSSSSDDDSSSSSVVVSSSSIVSVSSSSTDSQSSSSSVPLPDPDWSVCTIPSHVGKNEPIANLKFVSIENNNGRCGAITYKQNGTGSNITNLNYNTIGVGTFNITAYTTCGGTTIQKNCTGPVTVTNYIKFIESNADTVLTSGKTIVEVGGVSADMFGCQARDNSGSPNPFEGKTSFILNEVTVSVTDNPWWVKTPITSNRMLFESNNQGVGSYRCQIE